MMKQNMSEIKDICILFMDYRRLGFYFELHGNWQKLPDTEMH